MDNNSIFISGYMLRFDMPNEVNVRLQKRDYQIIKGTVYTSYQKPCRGAVIRVMQKESVNGDKKILGYALTDEYGEYAFALKADYFMEYELAVFAPLDTM